MFETSNQLYHIADTIPLYPHSIFQHWFPDSFSTPGSNDWLLSPHWLVVSVYLDAIVGENPIVGHISWAWLVLYHLLFQQTHLGFFYHLQNDCSLKMYSWIHVLSNLEVEPGGSSRVSIYVLHSVKYIYIYIKLYWGWSVKSTQVMTLGMWIIPLDFHHLVFGFRTDRSPKSTSQQVFRSPRSFTPQNYRLQMCFWINHINYSNEGSNLQSHEIINHAYSRNMVITIHQPSMPT